MKIAGLVFFVAVLALIVFFLFTWFSKPQTTLSPIHESSGVKVIYETPTQ